MPRLPAPVEVDPVVLPGAPTTGAAVTHARSIIERLEDVRIAAAVLAGAAEQADLTIDASPYVALRRLRANPSSARLGQARDCRGPAAARHHQGLRRVRGCLLRRENVMPVLESKLVIGSTDQTGGAFAAIKTHIAALDKQIGTFDKLMASTKGVAKANDPLIASIAASSKALKDERSALSALGETMARSVGATEGAAAAQGALATEIARATEVMVVQGATAAKVSAQVANAQRHQAAAAREAAKGFKGAFNEALPFAGPGILAATVKAVEAGASVQDEIARLKAAGATDKQIGQARSDFSEFSKTHSGVVEADYLAGFKDARVIAPDEQFEMARLGATYRAAARTQVCRRAIMMSAMCSGSWTSSASSRTRSERTSSTTS
jgi:hypothetical protein